MLTETNENDPSVPSPSTDFKRNDLETRKRDHGGETVEKKSWRRHHGGEIMSEKSWVASGGRGTQEAPRRPPGGTQEAPSKSPGSPQEPPRRLPGPEAPRGTQKATKDTQEAAREPEGSLMQNMLKP